MTFYKFVNFFSAFRLNRPLQGLIYMESCIMQAGPQINCGPAGIGFYATVSFCLSSMDLITGANIFTNRKEHTCAIAAGTIQIHKGSIRRNTS